MELIYCADGNRRFAQIAIDAGFLYGARLPHRGLHFAPHFADQDWKQPDRAIYMDALRQHRPTLATVLDLESPAQRAEVMEWAEEAATVAAVVIVIPKYSGAIATLPRTVSGAEVRLGYSVPTRYGGTAVPVWEFDGWPVHLLGGSPHAQMRLAHYLKIASADGNMANKLATQRCHFWTPGNARRAKDRYWPTLAEIDGEKYGHDAPYEAFRRSCENIFEAWQAKIRPPMGQPDGH